VPGGSLSVETLQQVGGMGPVGLPFLTTREWEERSSMNSVDVPKLMKRDRGMKVRRPYMALGFKRLTAREVKALLLERADAGDPEVQWMLNFASSGQNKEAVRDVPIPQPLGIHRLADG
jgi:hypothetical protein